MKKLMIGTVALLTLGLLVSPGLAFWGGNCNGPRGGGWYAGDRAPVDSDRDAAYQKYAKDTAGIRQQLAAKQAEYTALMANDNPDPKRAGDLAGEIAGLREQLRAKAPAYAGPGYGPGYRYGHMYGRHGGGPCSW